MKRKFYNQQFHSGLPVVNLLSPAMFKDLAILKLRRRFVAAGLALVVLVGLGWTGQHMRAAEATKLLAVEQAETARLAVQSEALAPVSTFVTEVAGQKTLVQKTMANEAYLARVLDGLRRATPTGVRIETVGATIDSPAEATGTTTQQSTVATCPAPDPFTKTVSVGCVIIGGKATSRAAVGQFVIRLTRSGLFVAPYISTTTATADNTTTSKTLTFAGSVALTKNVYSLRYADLTKLLPAGGR
jgi:hypothetical protein